MKQAKLTKKSEFLNFVLLLFLAAREELHKNTPAAYSAPKCWKEEASEEKHCSPQDMLK